MKRFVAMLIGTVVIFVISAGKFYAQDNAKDEEKKKEKEGLVSFGIDIRLPIVVSKTFVPTTLENVPTFVRMVPIHKNDSTSGKLITIPDSTIQPRVNNTVFGETLDHNLKPHTNPAMMGISVAPQITIGRLKMRAGVAAYLREQDRPWLHYAAIAQEEAFTKGIPYIGPIREWSQVGSGSARGYGTALVYYVAELKPKPPELFGEVEVGPFKFVSAVAGCSQLSYDLDLYSGWDRFDSLDEKYMEYPPIKIRIRREYFGVRLSGGLGAFGGSEESKSRFGIEFLVNHLSHLDQPIWQGYPVNLKYNQVPWSFTASIIVNLNLIGPKKH